jgi:hypothetical protein
MALVAAPTPPRIAKTAKIGLVPGQDLDASKLDFLNPELFAFEVPGKCRTELHWLANSRSVTYPFAQIGIVLREQASVRCFSWR